MQVTKQQAIKALNNDDPSVAQKYYQQIQNGQSSTVDEKIKATYQRERLYHSVGFHLLAKEQQSFRIDLLEEKTDTIDLWEVLS